MNKILLSPLSLPSLVPMPPFFLFIFTAPNISSYNYILHHLHSFHGYLSSTQYDCNFSCEWDSNPSAYKYFLFM